MLASKQWRLALRVWSVHVAPTQAHDLEATQDAKKGPPSFRATGLSGIRS